MTGGSVKSVYSTAKGSRGLKAVGIAFVIAMLSMPSCRLFQGRPTPLIAIDPEGDRALRPLAVDDTHLYFSERIGEKFFVKRMELERRQIELLFRSDKYVRDLLIDREYLYWIRQRPAPASAYHGEIVKMAKAGGPPEVSALSSFPMNLAANSNSLYWVNHKTCTIDGVSKQGGAVRTLAEGLSVHGSCQIFDMAVDDEHIYWTGNDGLRVMPVSGGESTVMVEDVGRTGGLVMDADSLYWLGPGNRFASERSAVFHEPCDAERALLRLRKQGQETPTVVFCSIGTSNGDILLDERHVYWIEPEGDSASRGWVLGKGPNPGRIRRVAKDGTRFREALVEDRPGLHGLAGDGKYVYWGEDGGLQQQAVW